MPTRREAAAQRARSLARRFEMLAWLLDPPPPSEPVTDWGRKLAPLADEEAAREQPITDADYEELAAEVDAAWMAGTRKSAKASRRLAAVLAIARVAGGKDTVDDALAMLGAAWPEIQVQRAEFDEAVTAMQTGHEFWAAVGVVAGCRAAPELKALAKEWERYPHKP